MSAISSVNNLSSVYAAQAAQATQSAQTAKGISQARSTQRQPIEDTVHLSQAAQAAIKGSGGGDADHDGDSH